MSTIHPDLADQLGQYRYILSRLGLSLWASKDDDQNLYCCLPIHQQDILGVASDLQVDTKKPLQGQQEQKPSYQEPPSRKLPLDFSKEPLNKPTSQESQQNLANMSNDSPVVNRSISYHLAALAYGSWILLVGDKLPAVEQGVWLSLSKALENRARLDQTPYRFRQLDYPLLNDMPDADQPLVAQMSFRGFVFGLINTDINTQCKLACLGDLPDGLKMDMLDGLVKVVRLPSLAQMSADANLKKQFWKEIHTKEE